MSKVIVSIPLEPTEAMMNAAMNAPIPAVHIDSISGRWKMEFKARFKAALRAYEKETETTEISVVKVTVMGSKVVSYTMSDGTEVPVPQ